MSTTSKIDPNTLGWVKTEIDESLKQAHLALESFVENPTDDTRLRFCVTHVHQVVGTLQMVELDGAAMLAREAEELAEAILDDQIETAESAFELLSRAILLLPDYLGGLQFGQPDAPFRLLPLINELRSSRNVAPVSEDELFTPDLSVRPPRKEHDKPKLNETRYAELAQKLRPAFQVALLNWLRNGNGAKALETISETVAQLQQEASVGVVEQLFWVAGGLLEALSTGGLEPTNERKKLVSRLDQQIKKLMDGSEKSVLRNTSEALVKSMLLQIGGAKSNGPKVTQLKRAFDLEALLGGAADDDGQITVELPEPDTIKSVSAALGEEVQAAQELLAAYFDPDQEEVDSLEPLLDRLRKMSSTMDLLGSPTLKGLVDGLLEVTRALVDGQLEPSQEVSMRMAHALLLVENCARDIWAPTWPKQVEDWTKALHGLLAPDAGDIPDVEGIEVSEVSEAEFGQLVGVVANEIRVNLTRVEEAVEAFATETDKPTHLDEIPGYINQIQGALQILGEERALQLSDVVNRRIDEIRSAELIPTQAVLDALAVCVGTLSAYAEGLQLGRPSIDDLMDAALNDMDAAVRAGELAELDPVMAVDHVQHNLQRWLDNTGDREAVEALRQGLRDIAAFANSQGQGRIERISAETNTLLAILADDPAQLSTEISDTLKHSIEALSSLAREQRVHDAAPEPAQPTSAYSAAPVVEPSDSADTTETVVVTTVEAESRAADREAAAAARPAPIKKEIETVALGTTPAAVTEPPLAATAADTPAADTTPVPAPAPPTGKTEPELDPEMLEIFTEEAREVLETINNEFPSWRDNPDNVNALAEVRRGLHTLKGSGRMVGASEIGELAWAAENLLNKVRDGKIPRSDAIFELVAKVKDVLPGMVDQLQGGPAPTEDIEALRRGAHVLASGEPLPGPAAVPKEVTSAPAPPPEREAETPAETVDAFPKLDSTLLRIFTNETRGHLDTIRREVAACRDAGGRGLVSTGLVRAAHTLQGGARSVGLPPMSESCGEMERLLQTLEALRFPLDDSHLALLDDMVACVSSLLEVLKDDSSPGGNVDSRFADLSNRIREKIAPLPAPEAEEQPFEEIPEPSAALHSEAADTSVPPALPAAEAPEEIRPAAAVDMAASTTTELATLRRDEAPVSEGIDEDIDPELVDVFLEEATDLLSSIEEALRQWRGNRADAQAMEDIKRALHTLKGGARMASANVVGNLAHNTEDLFKRIEEDKIAASAGLFDLLDEVHDTLVTLIDQIRHARPLASVEGLNKKIAHALAGEPVTESKAEVHTRPAAREDHPDVLAAIEPSAEDAATAEEAGRETTGGPEVADVAAAHTDRRTRVDEPEPLRERRDRRGQVRVRASVLTDLVNYAGEVSISRARMEQQVYGFRDNLGELNRNVVRFRDQLRELEIQSESQILYRTEREDESTSSSGFDPLELDRYSRLQQLSRSLTESVHDLSTIQTNLENFAGQAESVLQQQARINTSLQEGLMRTRMIPFSTQSARLRHIGRQTARELGKRVELRITGADASVDRNVLERMMGPFEHMIRNSLDHGIEAEVERKRAGKPPVGTITIDTRQEGNEIGIRFSDDGAGLDIGAIRRRAIENGLISEDKVLSDDELIQFILVSGFSTAREVTHLSGRGVGMDVVENEVKQLGGNMSVNTTPGEGTTFTIHLPLTLSITQALIVRVGDQRFAVPLSAIVNIIEVRADKMNITMGKNPLLNYSDKVYDFMNVGSRLGIPSEPRNGGKVPVLLGRIGTREVAIQVDGLAGTKEIVVKSLGPQLNELKGLAGATILGDGTVLLILDMGGLWLTDEALHVERAAQVVRGEKAARRPVVMVVDDSLTVRTITGRHLQKRGWEVLTAKDGVDALGQLQDHMADVVLVDIEMPRMDGYELTSRIRSDSRLGHIPIIIITSRAGEKHKEHAFDLGVNGYMSKPYQEDELFQNIENLLPQETVH